MTEQGTGQSGLISPRRSMGMLAANAWSALSLVVATAVAAHALSEADYTQFLVYWSLLFGALQVVTGLQNESTRAVSETMVMPDVSGATRGARVMAMPLILGGGLACVILVFGSFWASHVSIGMMVLVTSVLVLVNYGCVFTIGGVLAGRHQWGTLAFLNALEPSVRLCVMVLVALLIPNLRAMQLAAALPALAWLTTILPLRRVRGAASARADVQLPKLLANGLWALAAAAAGAVLLNAFPAIVRGAVGGDTPGLASLLLGIQLTRAPLMMPLSAFQGIAVAGFVAARHDRLRALVKPLGAVVGLGILSAGAAALLGPFLMRLVFGAKYALPGLVLGGLTLAVTSVALLTLSGTAAIAVGAHRFFMAGWITGALVTVMLLLAIPLSAEWRVILAVLFGPLFGVAIHVLAVQRRDRSPIRPEMTRR